MNAELQVLNLQNELSLAKKDKQILELQQQLQFKQAEKTSKLEDSLFSPQLYEHYQKVAIMMSKSEIVPTSYRGKPADIFIAMEMGYQLGFPIAQSLQDIAVINGRPCLWGDGLLALVLSHPDCEYIDEKPLIDKAGHVSGYRCTVKRKGYEVREQVFTLQDAQTAGLLKKQGPWIQYPKRMLQLRARAFALRDMFGDALRGFKMVEEVQDYDIIDAEISDVKPIKGSSQVDKLKSLIKGNKDVERPDAGSDFSESSDTGLDGVQTVSDDCEHDVGAEIGADDDNVRISAEQLETIEALFNEKGFSEERKERAFTRYKVTEAHELSLKDAKDFIKQLEKAQ